MLWSEVEQYLSLNIFLLGAYLFDKENLNLFSNNPDYFIFVVQYLFLNDF